MRKINKFLVFILILLGLVGSTSMLNVKAATAPDTITLKAKSKLYYYSEKNNTDYIAGYNFYQKKLTNGKYGYCVSNIDTKVPAGRTLSSKGPITDKGLDYIIKNGYPHKSFTGGGYKDYYITQSAIWEYFDQTRGSNNWKTSFKKSSTGMKKYVYNLVQGAKAARNVADPVSKATASINNTKMSLSSDGKYYVSNVINVNLENTKDTYTVNLVNAPSGTILKNSTGTQKTTFNKGEGVIVYVPASSVTANTNIKLSISADGVVNKTYYYSPGKSGYQYVAPVTIYEVISKIVSNQLTLNLEKQITKLKISKQDITSKEELAGAKLTIKNKNGKEVASWVSTTTPHYIENLAAGEYTLTEEVAPKGYVLSKETINFTLQADGKVKTVVMFNAKEKIVTKLKISKQDITSKEELAGAKLTIKDKNGKEVASWVSTTTPHYIEGLAAGEYTLTEEVAPKGYVLSTETINFTLQTDGKVKTVVMFNAKETVVTKVKISKQDITSKEELAGAKLTIKDKNGKEVASWVSTTTPHYIEGLAAGDYTLTEEIAPNGYVLSTETITFTVKEDGSVTSVVMFNAKESVVTKVKISKQDITSKEELAGATLTIKDKDGNVVESWVSETTPHYIEGLAAGDYTLTEEIAPEGYALSSETINFTIKDDGSVTSVIMFNARYTEVPITDLNVNLSTVVGAILVIVIGAGMIFYAKQSY